MLSAAADAGCGIVYGAVGPRVAFWRCGARAAQGLRALGRFGAVPGGMFRGLPRHEGGAVIAGGSHCSAAQRLRALGRFGATADGKICAPCMIRGVRAAKRAPSWQDLRAVYPPTAICGAFRMHGAHILPKPARFRMHGAQNLPRSPPFSSKAPFGIHGVKKLPRIAARERIRAQSCHRQAPGNAFHGHFAISERPQRHSAMCLNVLRRSPIDARAERPAHALRARRSCPPRRPPQHHDAMHRTRRFCRR